MAARKGGIAVQKILVALASLALGLAVTASQATELKLAHFMSPNHPYHDQVFNWLGTRLDTATNGDLTIRVFPGGELGTGPVEQFNRAVDGVADITFAIPGYTAAQFPKSLLMELPGVLSDDAKGPAGFQNAFDLIKDEYRRVKVLGLWNISRAVLFTTDKPVRSLTDLDGLKIRVGSKGSADLVEAWGATPVFLPVTEMYTALQTGVVDGTMIDPSAALAFKLTEVTDYMTVGMDSVLTTFMLVMNRDSYESLSASQRAALDREVGLPLSQQAYDSWAELSRTGADVFGATEGKSVITLNGDALAAFNAAAEQVRNATIADLEAKGIQAGDIISRMQGG